MRPFCWPKSTMHILRHDAANGRQQKQNKKATRCHQTSPSSLCSLPSSLPAAHFSDRTSHLSLVLRLRCGSLVFRLDCDCCCLCDSAVFISVPSRILVRAWTQMILARKHASAARERVRPGVLHDSPELIWSNGGIWAEPEEKVEIVCYTAPAQNLATCSFLDGAKKDSGDCKLAALPQNPATCYFRFLPNVTEQMPRGTILAQNARCRHESHDQMPIHLFHFPHRLAIHWKI